MGVKIAKHYHNLFFSPHMLAHVVAHREKPAAPLLAIDRRALTGSVSVVCCNCKIFLSFQDVQAVGFVRACNPLRLFVCFVLWL